MNAIPDNIVKVAEIPGQAIIDAITQMGFHTYSGAQLPADNKTLFFWKNDNASFTISINLHDADNPREATDRLYRIEIRRNDGNTPQESEGVKREEIVMR